MDALKTVLIWIVAVVMAGAALAVVLIPTLPLLPDDLFTKVLVAGASAALTLLLLIVFHRPILFYLRFIFKSLFRNLLRTGLTAAATMLLVFIVTLVWTVLYFLHMVTVEKSKDLKAIVTERWQIPSQMPFSYGAELADGRARADHPEDARPQDSMTWQFYGGTLEAGKVTRESIVFFFAMDPKKFIPMMDGMDEFTPAQLDQLKKWADEMIQDKHKVLIGVDRLKALNKKPGEHFTVHSINYKDIDLDVEILGALPAGRYGQSAVMNFQYLNDALIEDYPRTHGGKKHPLADKTLNLVWLRVPDTKTYEKVADQIERAYADSTPSVKCETASSGVASFLDAYRTLLWGMEYLFTPIALASITVVIATAISISVRERRSEMAILKVLGFGPARILLMILGEGLVIGAGSGLLSVTLTYLIVNVWMGGIPFPIAFFPAFKIPVLAFVWGPLIGGGAALAGSIVPALFGMWVNVAQVFAKTT